MHILIKIKNNLDSQILNFVLIQGPRGLQGDAGPPGEMGAEVIFLWLFLVSSFMLNTFSKTPQCIIEILNIYYGE